MRGSRRHLPRSGRPLYLRLWLAVLASLAAFALAVGLLGRLWWHIADDGRDRDAGWGVVAEELLPAGASSAQWQRTLDKIAARTGSRLALYAPDGTPIAVAGSGAAAAHGWQLRLDDGRRLVVDGPWRFGPRRGIAGFALALVLIALAVGVGAYPVVRRLTRRLEDLQHSVDAFGAGQLSARVPVRGHDEVAALARSFNRSAERIEALLRSNRSLLANASHELRSPLARIRMALELIGPGAAPDAHEEIRRNIGELDALIDELLLASRLEAGDDARPDDGARSEVDLEALVAEESARVDAEFELDLAADARLLHGDARLLRRLVRNLLENARRYGAGAPIEVRARRSADGRWLSLCVLDRGPGVAEDERERIFEPFYRARGASERAGGVGLGLSLVRQIARRHGGEVHCLARDGGGSCFEVRLPVTA